MENTKTLKEILQTRGIYISGTPKADPFAERRAQIEAERKRESQQILRTERNIELFLETPGLYVYDPMGKIPSQELYELYKNWCFEEKLPLKPAREFWLYVKEHASQYRLVYSVHIPNGMGKRVRGFYGIRPLTQQEKNASS